MSQLSFADRVVVVTGAGNGLGRSYALDLAKRGAKIVVNDLGGAVDGTGQGRAAQDVVSEIKALGGTAVPNFDSVATRQGGNAIIKTALDTWGRVDAVIANAGILRDVSFAKLTDAQLDAVLDVHLRGTFYVLQPAFQWMKEAGSPGRLIVTTSPSGLFGNFGQTNYGAAKMGVVGLARSLAIEGQKYGILTNAVAPVAATRLTAGVAGNNNSGSHGEGWGPDGVAPLVVFLAHTDCRSNGEIFLAAGGWYTRVAAVIGEGAVVAGDRLNAEGVQANWDAIRDVSHWKELPNALAISAIMKDKLGVG
jgi:NAD(P)-dependent dehydrogenase (short-subunit alcohol dehydrogenase family)